MTRTTISYLILAAFILSVAFGLYLNFSHAAHSEGCMYSVGEVALCSAPLAYIQKWQELVTSIPVALLIIVASAAVLLRGLTRDDHDPGRLRYAAYRNAYRLPLVTLLLQELYSDGILNRKEPSIS